MKQGIGVALSGGEDRASLFGLGLLLYLADAGKNHQVRSIASVSGGSLTNAYMPQESDFRVTSATSLEATTQPFVSRLATATTFTSAPISTRFQLMLGLTLLPAAVPVWFYSSLGLWLRLVVAFGLVAVWEALALRHLFANRLGRLVGDGAPTRGSSRTQPTTSIEC